MLCPKCASRVDDDAAQSDRCGAKIESLLGKVGVKPGVRTGLDAGRPLLLRPLASSEPVPAQDPIAGFDERVWAFIVDTVIALAIGFILGAMGLHLLISVPLSLLLYGTLLEASPGQSTFGKKLIGLRVVSARNYEMTFGKAVTRNFVKLFLGQFMLFGLLIAVVTRKRQALHDFAANTLVVSARWKTIQEWRTQPPPGSP
ncbi:MAG: RDD family protein [SAR202 cluster bacterium]|nr:RDD family protein [SAR202 cluster bacterium]